MTTLYLTRHGETIWNTERKLQGSQDSTLTDLGIKQAENLRDRLSNVDIDIIYCSPLDRALSTANIIKGKKNIDILIHHGLKEVDFGLLEGLKEEEINKKDNYKKQVYNLFNNQKQYIPLDGEELDKAKERSHIAIKEILNKNQDKNILIVTHGMLLNFIMMLFQNNDNEKVSNIIMKQATLTKIEINKEGIWRIIFKDDGSHHEF